MAGGSRLSLNNEYTAVWAERIEYSRVNTTSSGSSPCGPHPKLHTLGRREMSTITAPPILPETTVGKPAASVNEPRNYLNAELGIKSWLLTQNHKRIEPACCRECKNPAGRMIWRLASVESELVLVILAKSEDGRTIGGYACKIVFDSESGSGVESRSTAERSPGLQHIASRKL
jgi:hypothetical protein